MSKPLDPSLAEQYLAAIVQNADDAIVSKDLNSIVTSWNPAAARIFGFTADEMIGQSIMGIIPPELAGKESEIVMDCSPGNAAASSMTTVSAVNKWLVPVTSELIPPRNLCCCGSENETKVEREHSPPRRAGRGGVDATSVKRCEASLYWSGRGGQFGETRRIAEARAVDRLDRAHF